MEVSVRELKNHLSECLRRAKAGEDIVVTVHGKAVVRLVGIKEPAPDTEAAVIAELESLPWVRPGQGGRIGPSAHPMLPTTSGKPLSEILLEDRE